MVGLCEEDTTASGYQQNTTTQSGRHDLLLQKIVVLAPPYLQSYGMAIRDMNIMSLRALSGLDSREVLFQQLSQLVEIL